MMLLITFFMLCTTLAKPQAMQLTMPSNDQQNLDEKDRQVTKASHTLTFYLGADNKVWYVAGLPNYDDPSCVKETTYGKDGIEKVLNEHTTEEGINPIARIKVAKKELDAQKSKMSDKDYQDALKKLKRGERPSGEKVPTMTVIIRPLDTATYENMVQALDEMLISNIDKYVIDNVDKLSEEDKALIAKAGVK